MTSIGDKVNRVLNIILIAFVLIAIRVWYLAVIKHEEHKELAKRPQLKTVIENPNRGTIRDRFNIPLAVNKIQYNAAICYDAIGRLPRIRYVKNEAGQRIKVYYRKEYIEKFSQFLAKELDLDPINIEDLIYSKASIFPTTPLILLENIDEKTYYQLHIKERDWPGLTMQINSRRYYPKGEVSSNILGFLGAINQREFLAVRSELNILEKYLKERESGLPAILPKGYLSSKEVKRRFSELKNKSYTINSRVGKSGIEGKFDNQLRGISGKKKFEVDIRGNILRELPESYASTSGRRFILTISSELQEFAENLLINSEIRREKRFKKAGKNHDSILSPWIKGGSIVAIEPKTGEIVALASYPRFNPNDFIDSSKSSQVIKWLENPNYISQIWDGLRPLERSFNLSTKPHDLPSEKILSWNAYLDSILGLKSQVRKSINKIRQIGSAIYLQNAIETLFQLSEQTQMQALIDTLFPPEKGHKLTFYKTKKETRDQILALLHEKTSLVDELLDEISPYLNSIERNDDKILLLDLCRLICPNHFFDDRLLMQVGHESPSSYRAFNQATIRVQKDIYRITKKIFHEIDFSTWRKTYFKDFLKEKRKEEKLKSRYQKPYISYLHEIEKDLFDTFFEKNKWDFLACYLLDNAPIDVADERLPYFQELIKKSLENQNSIDQSLKKRLIELPPEYVIPYLKTMRSFKDLNRMLWGKYYFPFKAGKKALEKDLARHFYPTPGYGFTRSLAYQENAPLGSIFKILVGYEGLKQNYKPHNSSTNSFSLNPLTLIDQSPPYNEKMTSSSVLGYTLSGIPITRMYKGGRLPRGHLNIGRVDLPGALERSSNLYFPILAKDVINHPKDLILTSKEFGFGRKTGVDLSNEARGHLPNDLYDNPTALYSFAIGQHSLTVTPLQTSLFLAALANGGNLLKPQIVKTIANLEPSDKKNLLFNKTDFSYKDMLSSVGIYFPLFTEAQEQNKLPYIWKGKTQIQNQIFLPDDLRLFLLKGLFDVVNSSFGTARASSIRSLWESPSIRRTYKQIQPYLAGKTSTAEIIYRPCLDREFNPLICKHIWFGGISFKKPETLEEPDLIVIVYLRYGDHGKEAAPLAAQIIKKWKEISEKHTKK